MLGSIRDNSERASKLIAILKVYFVFAVLEIFMGIYQYITWAKHDFDPMLDSWTYYYDSPDVIAFDQATGLFYLAFLVIMIITYVRFIQWFRRAYCNLNRVGIKTEKSEGMASGAWFIPFYNLFAPCQIMKEIWNKTQRFYKDNVEESSIVGLWWGLWITGSLISNQGDGIGRSFFGDGLEAQTVISIISSLIFIPATIVVIKLVSKVSLFEKEMYTKSTTKEEALDKPTTAITQ